MKKTLNTKGFTLIEMLISMMIFVTFVSVLISSYTDIVKSQREANDYRMLYSEARHVFEKLTEEARNNSVYYSVAFDEGEESYNQEYVNPMSGGDEIRLVSLDGNRQVAFKHEDENIWFGELITGEFPNTYPLISEESERISVEDFRAYVSPVGDPYRSENTFADGIQFQPKVTFVATFVMERRSGGNPYKIDLQTTISSRLYSETLIVNKDAIF